MEAPERGFCSRTNRALKVLAYSVVALLLLVGCSKSMLMRVQQSNEQRWEQTLLAEAEKQGQLTVTGSGSPAASDFGRQLDTLTGFYETIISVLLGLLALVAGLAFWTIKVVTKAQAEETAMAEATRILGDHDNFRDRLSAVVREAVDRQMEEVREKLERLEEGYIPPNLAVVNPNLRQSSGEE